MPQPTVARRRKEERRRSRRRQAQMDWLSALKVRTGCVDCGYNKHPVALDFDHVYGDKRESVSRLVTSHKTWQIVLAEVAKCEVRCSNCHRIMTAERRKQASRQGVLDLVYPGEEATRR